MTEYPSILPSSRAPRKPCIVFEKLDGNNIRVKYTAKRGFHLFGSRTQLFDERTPDLGRVIGLFNDRYRDVLERRLKREFPNEREVVAFGEFFGPQSFAGIHQPGDQMRFVLFDILIGHKQPRFLLPQEFIKFCGDNIEIPRVLYRGQMGEALISDVRAGRYGVGEGVIAKGTERTDYAFGGVWMAKIKTQAYLDRLFALYGKDGMDRFGE